MVRLLDQQAEWIVALGRKSACERICAMICDIHDRLHMNGQLRDGGFCLPLTQADIADVVGLTPVHVNRVLRDLRAAGLIDLDGRRLQVLRLETLRDRAAGTARAPVLPEKDLARAS